MQVRFWGCRGSIPSPSSSAEVEERLVRCLNQAAGRSFSSAEEVREFVAGLELTDKAGAGGNTPCLSIIREGEPLLVIDMGSGLRMLGEQLMKDGGPFAKGGGEMNVLMSHTHWDHLVGLPFFRPAYIAGNRMVLHGCHPELESRVAHLFDPRHFPVPWAKLPMKVEFVRHEPGEEFQLGGYGIVPFLLNHPGDSYGYRVAHGDCEPLVYASDSAFHNISSKYMEYGNNVYTGAGALVFDSQFTFDEAMTKQDWGHCSSLIGVDLALRESVRRLILFHHDPSYGDDRLDRLLSTTRRYLKRSDPASELKVLLGHEGLVIDL